MFANENITIPMAKAKSAKRKRSTKADNPHKLPKLSVRTAPPPNSDLLAEAKSLQTLLSAEELETTTDTLNLLSGYPNVIKSRACKGLRVAVYNFRQACTTGVNTGGKSLWGLGLVPQTETLLLIVWRELVDTNLTGRITAAITDGKYVDARVLLAEMRIRGEVPKLGALCRWVRDLDVVSGLSLRGDGIGQNEAFVNRSLRDKELLLVLDAILRVTGPVHVGVEDSIASSGPIALQKLWDIREGLPPSCDVYSKVAHGEIFSFLNTMPKDSFSVVEHTPGPLRKPPNRYSAVLHASKDNAIPLTNISLETNVQHHPIVPNLSLISNVLTHRECLEIIAAAESIRFAPDAPVLEGDNEDSSVLAHNFYWLIDEACCGKLWERVRPYVPAQVGGKEVRGINRRFRVYRYVPGAEYRCHIDGAWPPSGTDPLTKAYIYDSSPPEARQSSLFTFLIYLNDEFEGGETTFFIPSAREGIMSAYPVKPVMGGVVMFPHGETAGALLHEGTGVRKGAKYVIRTDVLYDFSVAV